MIDPKIVRTLARVNDELLPSCINKISPDYNDVRKFDLKRQVYLDTAKNAKEKLIKDGVFQSVTLYPVVLPDQQKKIVALFAVANQQVLVKIRAILESYAVYIKQLRHLRLKAVKQALIPISSRLKRMGARSHRNK